MNHMVGVKVLLTGGSGRLGSVIIPTLLAAGAEVVATYHDTNRSLTDLPQHPRLTWLGLNLLEEELIEQFCRENASELAGVNCLIHNARSLISLAIQRDGWSQKKALQMEFDMAVTGPYSLTKNMLAVGQLSQLLFINSIYGKVVPNRMLYARASDMPPIQYGIAKAAQLHLAKELAMRLANDHVRVNSLVFGGVEGRAGDEFVARYEKLCPQQKMLNDEDVAQAVLAAINPKLTSVTGQEFVCDGGWMLW